METQMNTTEKEEANVKWVEENQSWIDEVGLEVHASGNTILFYSPTHEQVIRIIREIGGKWSKRYNASTIAYSYHLPDYSRSFILCDSQPPGTCRMVPVVEIVPARWEPEKIPDDWQFLRDAWLRNHWLRTYFGIAAFLFSLGACFTR